MLKKEEVYIKVGNKKKAKKLATVLDMFGFEYHIPYYESLIVFDNEWDEGLWHDNNAHGKTKVSLKELRNILAVEHLKEGDVVVCKDGDEIALGVFKEWESQFGFDLDNVYYLNDPECHSQGHGGCFGNFIRYAAEEEKALLEPKKELEVGKWYFIENKNCSTRKTDALVFIKEFKGDDNTNYGFDSRGDWTDKFWADDLKNMGRIVEATPQEVEEALIKEAKRRGFVGGVKILPLVESLNNHYTLDGDYANYYIDKNRLYVGCVLVFKDGKWAEVIEHEKSLEERVKELEEKVKQLENK